MKKILITGTAGFIGFHLAERLAKEGWNIVGLDNINDYYDVNLKYARLKESGICKDQIEYNKCVLSEKYENYRFIKLDLQDKENIFDLFERENFEYVVNLAAQAGVRYSLENPYVYINSNIYGFLNILEGCRQYTVKHLVYASSSSVYGSNSKLPFSVKDNVDNPISLYAATKKSNELMAHTYSHLFKISTTGLRFFTVYGPWGRPDMAYFKFAQALLEEKVIDVFNKGNMKRDFTYIDDIIEGINNLLKNQLIAKNQQDFKVCSIYNLGNNRPVKLMQMINILESKLNKVAKINFMPVQQGDVLETLADIDEATESFGYRPNINIEVGIERFVTWFLYYHTSCLRTDNWEDIIA